MRPQIAFLLLLLLCAATAGATSFVMVSDRNLAAQAPLVAQVNVLASGPGSTSAPSTEYLVEVERVVQGDAPGSRLVVRVPGGVGAHGLALQVFGAPRFAVSERALLFLVPQPDGAYGVLHLMLGAFHVRGASGREVALRDLSETSERSLDGTPVERGPEPARDLARFAAWIGGRGEGEADYFLAEQPTTDGGLREAAGASTELAAGDGLPIRWFVFDGGGHVDWKMDPAGQTGLGAAASQAAFQAALADWTNDPTSTIDYELAGLEATSAGLTGPDGVNAILFGDPGDRSVPGAYSCKTGGVLAIGGPYFYLTPSSYNGRSFHEAFEADVVTNDGSDCFFRNNPKGAEEVFAHELGHTLGLGHSADKQALMFAVAHNDGRGGRLGSDDRLAVNRNYGDGTLRIAGPPAATPFVLTAGKVSRNSVPLTWTGNPAGVDRIVVETKIGKVFRQVAAVAPDAAQATVSQLRANCAYTFRVTAYRGKTATRSSNAISVTTAR